jgi:hypothetical protein
MPKRIKVEEVCTICQDSVLKKDSTKIVHITPACEHKFHTVCIDKWCQHCFKNNKHPTCPLCPNYKIPLNICPEPHCEEEYEDEEEEYEDEEYDSEFHEIAVQRLHNISYNIQYETRFRIPIFMGIMVCIDDNYILKYSNRQLNLNLSSTLQEIKEKVIENREIIYNLTRMTRTNFRYNMVLDNWLQWKYPEITIADVHFGIPPYRQKIGLFDEPLDDNAILAELYERYQTLAGEMVNNRIDAPIEASKELDIIYSNRLCLHEWGPTGPDDNVHYEYGFYNPENPTDSFAYGTKGATYNPLAWITVHVTYS